VRDGASLSITRSRFAGNDGIACVGVTYDCTAIILSSLFVNNRTPSACGEGACHITIIPYSVGPGGGQVTLRVYDAGGRLVATLVDEVQGAGAKTVQWDGRSRSGSTVASGVYFYKLSAPGFEKTLKMTVVR
jgi:hypothetical protein